MVQQMLISTLSTIGIQCKNSTKLWYVDSGAENHMINTSIVLYHVQPYDGQLPITTVGDVSSTFTDVFLAHKHATNLIFIG